MACHDHNVLSRISFIFCCVSGGIKKNQVYLEFHTFFLHCFPVYFSFWINFTLFSAGLDFFSMNVKHLAVASSIIKLRTVFSQCNIMLGNLKKACKIYMVILGVTEIQHVKGRLLSCILSFF